MHKDSPLVNLFREHTNLSTEWLILISCYKSKSLSKSSLALFSLNRFYFPLDEWFVFSANRKHRLEVFADCDTHNMLTVGTVAARSRYRGIWEIKYIYKPKVIACQHNISRPINIINVSFIFSLRLQTMTVIAIFHCVCGPYVILSSLLPMWITLLFRYIIIKYFVITRRSSDSLAISRPIDCVDPSMISVIWSIESVLVSIWIDFINIKVVIVRANSKEVFTWRIFCNFAPLLCWF